MYLTNMNISIYFIIDTSQNRTKFSNKEKIWSGQCVGHYLRMIWGGSTASTSVWAGSWALSFLFLYDSAASLICLIHLINEWRREMFIRIIVSINGLYIFNHCYCNIRIPDHFSPPVIIKNVLLFLFFCGRCRKFINLSFRYHKKCLFIWKRNFIYIKIKFLMILQFIHTGITSLYNMLLILYIDINVTGCFAVGVKDIFQLKQWTKLIATVLFTGHQLSGLLPEN